MIAIWIILTIIVIVTVIAVGLYFGLRKSGGGAPTVQCDPALAKSKCSVWKDGVAEATCQCSNGVWADCPDNCVVKCEDPAAVPIVTVNNGQKIYSCQQISLDCDSSLASQYLCKKNGDDDASWDAYYVSNIDGQTYQLPNDKAQRVCSIGNPQGEVDGKFLVRLCKNNTFANRSAFDAVQDCSGYYNDGKYPCCQNGPWGKLNKKCAMLQRVAFYGDRYVVVTPDGKNVWTWGRGDWGESFGNAAEVVFRLGLQIGKNIADKEVVVQVAITQKNVIAIDTAGNLYEANDNDAAIINAIDAVRDKEQNIKFIYAAGIQNAWGVQLIYTSGAATKAMVIYYDNNWISHTFDIDPKFISFNKPSQTLWWLNSAGAVSGIDVNGNKRDATYPAGAPTSQYTQISDDLLALHLSGELYQLGGGGVAPTTSGVKKMSSNYFWTATLNGNGDLAVTRKDQPDNVFLPGWGDVNANYPRLSDIAISFSEPKQTLCDEGGTTSVSLLFYFVTAIDENNKLHCFSNNPTWLNNQYISGNIDFYNGLNQPSSYCRPDGTNC